MSRSAEVDVAISELAEDSRVKLGGCERDVYREDECRESVERSFSSTRTTSLLTSQVLFTAVLFDVDTIRIYGRHCEVLKSTTLNVPAGSNDNA
ncbi:hypothetical protein Tco_0770328 [Tanacetum coccineum]|uniref:Uncharacterized protein n=1 Tax=Tanacetum coccineum TaxID=301880 RepID=A0ABQ4ZCX7_9ASTR